MNVLMISSTFPYPPTQGGTEVRTFNLSQALRERGHHVTIVTQRVNLEPDQDWQELAATVDRLQVFPQKADVTDRGGLGDKLAKGYRFLESFIQGVPPNLIHRRSSHLQAWVDEQVQQGNVDVITCEHSVNTIYIRPDYLRTVRVAVNVHSSLYGAMRDNLTTGASEYPLRDWLYLPTLYRYENNYCRQPYRLVVTTPEDGNLLRRFNPEATIAVIPNGVDLDLFPPRQTEPQEQSLIFVGAMDIVHNIDAAEFFARTVFPPLRQIYPQLVFRIVGSRPTPKVQALADIPGVEVTGRVPSMVDYLHRSLVCVVPLRTGYGIKNKTLEAMAAGVPVVGSDRGLEGLAVDGDGVPLRALRANQVTDYVTAVSRLLDDSALRSHLAQNARQYIEQDFTWATAGERYEQALS